jgi:hypothetical protein
MGDTEMVDLARVKPRIASLNLDLGVVAALVVVPFHLHG